MAGNPPMSNDLTWRSLNREGCELGRSTEKEVSDLSRKVNDMESKIDAMIKALVGAALTLATATIMLALNLIF